MKIKYLFIYGALAVAFAGVSFWVFLSGGKAAKAIRAKYRIGGLMLTVWGMLSLSSCNGIFPGTSCYDPAPPSCVVGTRFVKPGDVLTIDLGTYKAGNYKSFIGEIYYVDYNEEDPKHITIQKDELVLNTKGQYEMKIAPTEYFGGATLEVFGVDDKQDEHLITFPETVYLNVPVQEK